MNLYIDNHKYHYEMENLIRVFFPNDKIEKIYECETFDIPFVYTNIGENIEVRLSIDNFDKTLSCNKSDDNELEMANLLYELLVEYTGKNQPWGLLTGIRPIKLFDNLQKEVGEKEAQQIFLNNYHVSNKKMDLTLQVYNCEKEIKSKSTDKSFSLYISIPFCPSRCNYCSFVSSSITKTKHLVDEYIPLLCKEIKKTSQIANNLGLHLVSVYMGGGTPTTLSAEQLNKIINEVYDDFDMSECVEFTVEAGRPDTITREKLQRLKKLNISRISINPQTMSDLVLETIGRKHSVRDTYDAYRLAREEGFSNINMDVIAGLSGDNLYSFKNTINELIKLNPESITVHTLALKSGSSLFMNGKGVEEDYAETTKNMVDYAYDVLTKNQYLPYYLYRQSKMLANLENVGYSKKGYESYYNVYVMEETHSILACGAGAVSKLRDPNSNYLERIFNFKYPFEYIDRFSEMLDRKNQIIDFYHKYFIN